VFGRLLILFVCVPFVELWLLLKMSESLGWGWTLLLVVGTGVIGAWVARDQGAAVMRKLQSEMAGGRMPAESIFDGVALLVAGALLVTPGVLTDLVGFGLLLPRFRLLLREWIKLAVSKRMTHGQIHVSHWED
jgi:UPF0716 protein FxsA